MIHQYKNNGYNIVLDVNSGAIHVVDDIAYDVIECYDKFGADSVVGKLKDRYDEKEILDTLSEVEQLKADGALFTDDDYEDYITDVGKRPTVIKAMCLHVSHDCNLRCRYCFAGEGKYRGESELMSLEVGKRALEFLVENSGNRRNLEVDFFGGEPLMNFEVVKELTSYGRELEKKYDKNFRFTLTTNGTLVNDDVMDFADREIGNVVMSIDGRKSVNDYMRPYAENVGSYDRIVPKFKEFAKRRQGKSYYVRGTYTRNNLDFSRDVLHLADLGFDQISVEPVVAKPEDDYSIREQDITVLFDEYDKLSAEMARRQKEGNAFNFFHFMIDLEGGPCVAKRLSGCGSGTEYVAVTPAGDIYPCHQFVGDESMKMGDVFSGIDRTDIVDKFKKVNVYSKKKCRECFAKFYCSGGCAANAYNFTGDINGTYDIGCELQKKRVECAIMLKIASRTETE